MNFYAYLAFVCFLLIVIVMLLYKLYSFSLIILKIEDVIEESLDKLDQRYQSIGEILKKEVFFDSVEVRQVIADISESHSIILDIANNLSDMSRENSEIKEKNN